MRSTFCLLLTLMSNLAHAQTCPTYADLQSGVRVVIGSGAYYDFIVIADGTVLVEEHAIDETRHRTMHYTQRALETRSIEYDTTGLRTTYWVDFTYDFPRPFEAGEGRRFNGTQFENNMNGEQYKSKYHIKFSSTRSLFIGKCEYPYIEVTKRYEWGNDDDEAKEIYLPSLGLLLDIDPSISYNLDLLVEGHLSRLVRD